MPFHCANYPRFHCNGNDDANILTGANLLEADATPVALGQYDVVDSTTDKVLVPGKGYGQSTYRIIWYIRPWNIGDPTPL